MSDVLIGPQISVIGQRVSATASALDYFEAQMSFETNLKRLEEIVAQLEAERLDLNTSLRLFEEGIELLRLASEELGETETHVKELIERADGVLELKDLNA
jgi:exodeoxyribonuclease VII small subunit